MAVTCPSCRSDLVQALLGNAYQCVACSAHFDPTTGEPVRTSHDSDDAPVTGPPPAVDPDGKYDHTGPYPTPAHATPPDPDRTAEPEQAEVEQVEPPAVEPEPVDDGPEPFSSDAAGGTS